MQGDPRRAGRQDTFDLRDQIHSDENSHIQAHAEAASASYTDDEEHSVLEDDSEGEERDDYMDDEDDGSSSLSIPNESIDFDLVYSLHSFAATVDGQANVVKGDSLFLMDDSNSYWWLVRVLKTQEVGYIPAENIETPFERLARLNKHRNVDLASATQAELQENLNASQDRLRNNMNSRAGSNHTPSPIAGRGDVRGRSRQSKGVQFTPALSVHRYPPAVWDEDEVEEEGIEWDDEGYEDEDAGLADEQMQRRREEALGPMGMEPDDGMQWDDAAAEDMQARSAGQTLMVPDALQPASARAMEQQQKLRMQQQQLMQEKQQELLRQQQQQLQQAALEAERSQMQQVQLQQQQLQQQQLQQSLRPSNSRERLNTAGPTVQIDMIDVTETKKLTVTPNIAREKDVQEYDASAAINTQKEEERLKRIREEEAAEEARKKARGKEKMATPVSSTPVAKTNQGGKLRKEPSREPDEDGKEKKKKSSVFGGLFGRKKDKPKDRNASVGSLESGEYISGSEESGRSGHKSNNSIPDGIVSPTTVIAMQQQGIAMRMSSESKSQSTHEHEQQQQPTPVTPERISPHANQLRQRDQQHQALYQQYLNRSPSSPPEAHGLQSAVAILAGSNMYHSSASSTGSGSGLGPPASRPRPGSIILPSSTADGQGPNVPDLSVIRVFAGKNLQTEATFKTVLLNASTTSADLVKQAIQRFHLPAGEDPGEYYLTIKRIEGGASAVLMPQENPLVVFESLVVEAMELPKVKRSSVGSISSIASNLSAHPAIRKLPMNDFSDDSAVKFYLNRRGDDLDSSNSGHEGDQTLVVDTSHGEADAQSPLRSQYLTVSSPLSPNSNVSPERFITPSVRFGLQLVIYPEDLPDDMVFHPLTEAIVFKDTLRESTMTSTPTVSPLLRRKVFMFPKNVTVAEVIELGLERFGISEGVVDGGDEIEDKLAKRRSSSRVRYGLVVNTGNHERELAPSSKVIDAFPRPPTYRAVERQNPMTKRRSVDSTQLLGGMEDVSPDDPIFVLRRSISYRNSTSRHRISAPLDEIALQHLHRESASSNDASSPIEEGKPRQLSRQELIAAQRAATRANQRAILSAQTNSVRGMDVLLPGNVMLRSSRFESTDRMRYSYVEPDGETYDISDIVEEEWRENNPVNKRDLLEGVITRGRDGINEKLDRVLNKIKIEKSVEKMEKQKDRHLSLQVSVDSRRSSIPSEYSVVDEAVEARSRSVTPGSAGSTSRFPSATQYQSQTRKGSNEERGTNSGTTTPTNTNKPTSSHRRHPSIASVMSDFSGYATPPLQASESPREASPRRQQRMRPIPPEDYGLSHMMAIIEYKSKQPRQVETPLDPVDAMLFGRPLDLDSIHPSVRGIYANGFKQLEEIDKVLDSFLQQSRGQSPAHSQISF